MLVKSWNSRGWFWIGEPYTLDGQPITSIETLGNYVERNGHVLLYAWANGETEQRQAPKLLNVAFAESWEECGFDAVITNLPEKTPTQTPIQKNKARLGKRRRWT